MFPPKYGYWWSACDEMDIKGPLKYSCNGKWSHILNNVTRDRTLILSIYRVVVDNLEGWWPDDSPFKIAWMLALWMLWTATFPSCEPEQPGFQPQCSSSLARSCTPITVRVGRGWDRSGSDMHSAPSSLALVQLSSSGTSMCKAASSPHSLPSHCWNTARTPWFPGWIWLVGWMVAKPWSTIFYEAILEHSCIGRRNQTVDCNWFLQLKCIPMRIWTLGQGRLKMPQVTAVVPEMVILMPNCLLTCTIGNALEGRRGQGHVLPLPPCNLCSDGRVWGCSPARARTQQQQGSSGVVISGAGSLQAGAEAPGCSFTLHLPPFPIHSLPLPLPTCCPEHCSRDWRRSCWRWGGAKQFPKSKKNWNFFLRHVSGVCVDNVSSKPTISISNHMFLGCR